MSRKLGGGGRLREDGFCRGRRESATKRRGCDQRRESIGGGENMGERRERLRTGSGFPVLAVRLCDLVVRGHGDGEVERRACCESDRRDSRERNVPIVRKVRLFVLYVHHKKGQTQTRATGQLWIGRKEGSGTRDSPRGASGSRSGSGVVSSGPVTPRVEVR